MRKIGIIGSGAVAKALGNGFIKYGYEVMLGSRDISKLADWKTKAGASAGVGDFEEVAKYGELLVLAVKGSAAADIIDMAGPQHFAGKTVIDTTNPISADPPQDGIINFFTNKNESLMEIMQDRFPAIHFVKAFNSVGNGVMVDPVYYDGKPTMFICGNNDAAKAEVNAILQQFGWDVADMGKAAAARPIESLCILWCIPGFKGEGWNHTFKLIKP